METQGEHSIKDIAEQRLPVREADPTNKHKASPTRRQYQDNHINQIPRIHGKHLYNNRESEEGRWNCSGLQGRLNGGNITHIDRNSPMEDQDNHSYLQGNHTSLADNHNYQKNNHNYLKEKYTCPSNNHNYNQNSYNLNNHCCQSSNHNSSQNNHNYLPNNHGQDSQNISKSIPTQHRKTDSYYTPIHTHTHTPRHSYHLTNHTHIHPARPCNHPAYHRPRYLLPLLLLSVVVPADGGLLDFAIPQMVQYGACIQPQTASDLDLPRFGGVWYPVMEVPNSYVEAKECIRSDYRWNGASIDVHSEGLDEFGDLSLQETSITQVMPADPTRPRPFLQIRSPNVPPVPYHILSTDYQTIACAYSCFEFLGMKVEFYSILSRTPSPSNVTLQACFEEFKAQRLDLSKMEAVVQGEECWYSEVYPASSSNSASSGSATSGPTISSSANPGPDFIPLSYPRPNPEMSPLYPAEKPAPPTDISPDLPPHPSIHPPQTLPSLTNPSFDTPHPPLTIPPTDTPYTLPPLIIPPPPPNIPPAATPPPLHIPPPDTPDTPDSNLSLDSARSSSADSKPNLPVDDPLKAIDDQQRALDILVEDPEDLSQCDPPSSSSSSLSSPFSALPFFLLFLLSFHVER